MTFSESWDVAYTRHTHTANHDSMDTLTAVSAPLRCAPAWRCARRTGSCLARWHAFMLAPLFLCARVRFRFKCSLSDNNVHKSVDIPNRVTKCGMDEQETSLNECRHRYSQGLTTIPRTLSKMVVAVVSIPHFCISALKGSHLGRIKGEFKETTRKGNGEAQSRQRPKARGNLLHHACRIDGYASDDQVAESSRFFRRDGVVRTTCTQELQTSRRTAMADRTAKTVTAKSWSLCRYSMIANNSELRSMMR